MNTLHHAQPDNERAFEDIKHGNVAHWLARNELSLRNLGLLLGDDSERLLPPRPGETMLCLEATEGRLAVDAPKAAPNLMHAAKASRKAVAAWLRAHAHPEYRTGRLADWAHHAGAQR
jgi:hypothetical protein